MPDPGSLHVAVVIPAYQAGASLGRVYAGVRAAVPDARVWVVDDGSTDGSTRDVPADRVLRHPENLGKGAALRTGIDRALTDGATAVVTIDADGQHPPAEIPRMLVPLRDGSADLVLGARARTGRMPIPRRVTNWVSSTLASRIGGVGVPDAQTGFRALTADLARAIQPAERHYDFEAAFLLAALASGRKVVSVSIPTIYDDSHSYFRTGRDTWRMALVFSRYAGRIVSGAR